MRRKQHSKRLRNSQYAKRAARPFSVEPLEHRIVLAAPQFVSVQPNGGEVLSSFDILNSSPRELTIRFDQDIDGSDASLNGIRVLRDGVEIDAVSRELGLLGNTVVLRFAAALPDDIYSIQVTEDLLNAGGEAFDPSATGNSALPLNFELDLGTKVSAVVPQPITRTGNVLSHALNQIEIYFNDDDLSPSLAGSTDYYRLILTQDTVTNTDDEFFAPTSADYSEAEAKVVLTFADDLHNLAAGDGTFRLRVGTNETNPSNQPLVPTPTGSDPADTFTDAFPLPALTGTSQIVQSSIDAMPFDLPFPGSGSEPGQSPFFGSSPDATDGVTVIEYNFMDTYGGGAGINLITEPQKERVREAFEILSQIAGVDVVETDTAGFTIATGDPQLGDPLTDLVLSNGINWNDEALATGTQGQPSYFAAIFSRLTGSRTNLPSGLDRLQEADAEGVFPTNDVLVSTQHVFRPDSVDIDLYKFDISGSQAGLFTAEILAERSPTVSLLDSVLRLYRETDSGARELIAQNDDYFSEDSYLRLGLEPGTYYIGVSSTGNDQYDPTIAGTGIGGTSQGGYELRLDFRPDISDSLADSSEVAFDGDGDGTPGGVYNFWFRAAAPSGSEGRNEVQEFDIIGASAGTFTINFDGEVTAPIAHDATAPAVEAALEALSNVGSGNVSVTGTALPGGPLSIEFTGDLARTDVVQISLDTSGLTNGTVTVATITNGREGARIIYVDKADTTPDNQADVGTLANPYNVIYAALNLDIDGLPQNGTASDPNAARAGDIVRILGNGDSPETSQPYEVGLNAFNNQPLADGAKIDIPNDVTVMVDAGAVFKMRRSAIIVGSSSVGIDHSLAALQVLGTPDRKAVFTSVNDFVSTLSNRGDWGGILFASDLDQDSFRNRYEEVGIFLNHIGQADIRYGGGVVNVGSIPQEIAPIDIRDARPTIKFNNLTTNAVAAMSATPDSFEETNFHSSEFQSIRFTADYARVGPAIQDNTLSGNTINGLFIRIDTPAGAELERQTVSARWNDADIVHVLSEVLEVRGTPGGPYDAGALMPRTDARLSVDPNVIVKLDGARIEVAVGAQLIAEGLDGQQVTFTSINDDRFGASGTFDTSNNNRTIVEAAGDWGGIYAGHSSTISLDHVLLGYAGGISAVEGSFVGFNAVEIQQATARIANSTFINNASGVFGTVTNREGRGLNEAATVFVRGAQPIILNNQFLSAGSTEMVEMAGVFSDITPAISINANSLNRDYITDYGRSTGNLDRFDGALGNQGPLIRNNRLDDNDVNGLLLRGEPLDTEGVWDDTDIVHVLFDPIYVGDFHTLGGLRLESKATESLVVKLGSNAGFNASGRAGFINDRIGGSVHVIGQPGRPVVLTSVADNTVGAGRKLDGSFQNDTVRAGLGSPRATGGLEINLNFSNEVVGNPILVAALEEGARFWESQLTDDITIGLDIFVANLGQPGTLANASADGFAAAHDTVIAAMQMDAAADEIDLLSRLPNATQISIQGPPGQTVELGTAITMGLPNAKALGFDVTGNPSQAVVGATRDGQININTLIARSSTINQLVTTVIHEIGHTLGFGSNVPGDGQFGAGFTLTTWDLFRMAPGAGAADFTNNPRVIDPDVEQVIYDGGIFDPVGIDIPGITRGDVPVSRGTDPHPDDGQPSHWRSAAAVGINGINLGLMSPSGGSVVRDNDLRSLGLMGWDISGFSLADVPSAGDWEGIALDMFSNDRNVETVVEIEGGESDAIGSNGIPDRAEFLGGLAASDFEGDENLRLGFEVHGVLNSPDDRDVFSFEGIAGTPIWLDVDHTAPSLDTVVELVDANAQTLALSNNSIDGAADLIGSDLVTPVELVDPASFYPFDHFSVNPKDPGMRLTLPGEPGTRGTYFVRMQSDDALTQGAYELNIRLGEVDEVPGSTVRFADIRYATNGISADGLIATSPLLAEFVEAGDVTSFDVALKVGDPYSSKRGEISISGSLEAPSTIDVTIDGNDRVYVEDGIDWYQFSAGGGFSLDIDYADGLGNPDVYIAVYQVGTTEGDDPDVDEDDEIIYHLIYFGSKSDVEDDRGSLLFEGSFGPGDPFIGPISGGIAPSVQTLRDESERDISYGNDFIVAVTSEGIVPEEIFNQYNTQAFTGQGTAGSIRPVQRVDIDLATVTPVPFTLDDLALYVASDSGTVTQLQSVNPYSGDLQEGARAIADDETGYSLGSLAMRPDGSLFSLSLGTDTDSSGNLISIDWANPLDDNRLPLPIAENVGDDEIVGYTETMPDEFDEFGDGINFFGMHINSSLAYGVGERGAKSDPNLMGPDYVENLVYAIDIYETEIDFNQTAPGLALPVDPKRETDMMSPTYFGAIRGSLTDVVEVGAFNTPGGLVQGLAEVNGVFYGVTDQGGLYSLTPGGFATRGATQMLGNFGVNFAGLDLGPQNLQNGMFANTLFAITTTGELFAFDLNGNQLAVFANGQQTVQTGLANVQGLAFSTLDQNLWEAGNPGEFLAPDSAPIPFFTGNQSAVDTLGRDYNYPGGAHGAFDFQVDLTADVGASPHLYFDYNLRTELPAAAAFADGNRGITVPNDNDTADPLDDFFEDTNRDTLRVYATVSAAPGETDWVLVATNNAVDIFNPGDPMIHQVSGNVQRLFDNTRLFQADPDHNDAFFRQARIPLDEFEGNLVTFRVEFSSEGTFFVNGITNHRPGHNNGDYGHIPERRGETTDNQIPPEVAADNALLGVQLANVFVGNTERGEEFNHPVLSEADNTATPPRFVLRGFGGVGNYQLYIRPGIPDMEPFLSSSRFARFEPAGFMTEGIGDTNRYRGQGQLIIHSNSIVDSEEYGIRVESTQGVAAGAADLVITNTERLVRGPVIENNVIANSGLGGIRFAGDETGIGAVQFGRITNNTVVGDPFAGEFATTVGIDVGPTASPTLMNNIVAYNAEGISVQASSASTVIAGTLFHGNLVDGPAGQFPLFSTVSLGTGGSDGLFRNPFTGNYLLVDDATAIDSAINSQEDRPSITSVSSSLGLDFFSPILAPDRDARGQLRQDDPFVESPPGLGSNVIKDRGALERADRAGPRGELLTPVDNSTIDQDSTLNLVRTEAGPFNFFEIRLFDVDVSGNSLFGVGIDDASVLASEITVRRDSQELVENVDYTISYDATSDVLRFIPVAGVWTTAAYEIQIGNDILTDLAGNRLAANQLDGTTSFFVELLEEPGPEGDYGDAPTPYPTRFSDGGAVHLDTATIFLGAAVDRETNGFPSVNADGDANDDGIAFESTTLFLGNNSAITATASAAGFLDAWIDFDRDGLWASNEQVFMSEALSSGENSLTFDVPSAAIEGPTYARFRFSSDSSGLAPGGETADGEVEDYRLNIADPGSDFGDAPDPYPEASHRIVPGYHLGAINSAETETSADDASDDGVVLDSSVVLVGTESSVIVTPTAAGVLEAWIDFNGDGDWDEAGEQLFGGPLAVNTTVDLGFAIPGDAVTGSTWARFRFSDGTDVLSPGGSAASGEVEDYLITIADVTANWHNAALPQDVNASGQVSPLDALLVINELNGREVSDPVTGVLDLPANPPPFYDVTDDGIVSPSDALAVINVLNDDPPSLIVGGSDPSASGISERDGAAAVALGDDEDESNQNVDLALRSFASQDREDDRHDGLRREEADQDAELVDDLLAVWS